MDKRLKCICTKSANGTTIISHQVQYELDHDSKKKRVFVLVKASEMTNPADDNELKTKADVKASVIKAAWVASISVPQLQYQNDSSVAGDVTL